MDQEAQYIIDRFNELKEKFGEMGIVITTGEMSNQVFVAMSKCFYEGKKQGESIGYAAALNRIKEQLEIAEIMKPQI